MVINHEHWDSGVYIFISPLWHWKGLLCFVISHVGLYPHLLLHMVLFDRLLACQCNYCGSYTWSVSCQTWKWSFIIEDRCSIHPQGNILSQGKRPQSEVKHMFTFALSDVIFKVGRRACYQSHSFYALPVQSAWNRNVLTWTINGDNLISSE